MNTDDLIRVIQVLTQENLLLKSQISKQKEKSLSDYYAAARLLTEFATLEDEKRKVKYLSPFAEAPSVAEQNNGVVLIGHALSGILKKRDARVNNHIVTKLLLWHDAPESRYGDLGRDQRRYISINEDKARSDIFGGVSWGGEIIDLIELFEAGGEDINIKVARDADALYVVYTIKDLLQKKYYINDPKMRIEKTLKRLATEEGIALGQMMAQKSPSEIWKLLNGPPSKNLALTMACAWALFELNKLESGLSQNDRDIMLELILTNTKTADEKISTLIADSALVQKLIEEKRKSYNTDAKKLPTNDLTSKLKNEHAKKLANAINEIDLFEWWNILMGYASLNEDGTIAPIIR